MAENIVIVESPTKSKTIKEILNHHELGDLKDFDVLSTKGHIYELCKNKGKYGLGIDLEHFDPIYQVIAEKKPLVKTISKSIKGAKNIFIATDPDREGEAIGYHLIDALNIKNIPIKRIEFYEITEKGILNGIQNPRDINLDLVNSQEARRLLDRIVGFRLSKLLQTKILSKSAGRVQSVALKLICDQENLINAFKKTTYYSIVITLDNDVLIGLNSIKAPDGNKVKIADKSIINEIIDNLNSEFVLDSINKKVINIQQPQPLITSTILQKSPYSTKMTEAILQKLFEGIKIDNHTVGLITYHRTDSTRLSEDFIQECQDLIQNQYSIEYLKTANFKVKVKKNSKINVQNAHEAIRPTYLKYAPDKLTKYLSPQELAIYTLIYNYAIASQMAPAKLETAKYLFINNNYEFSCNSSKVLFPGFKIILQEYEDKKPSEEDKLSYTHDKINLVLKQAYKFKNKEILAHDTQPPARYSEAKLIKTLEKLGIGRPSTYGKIIANIVASGYIQLINKQFKPTIRGMFTNIFIQNNFKNYISEDFTADMENKLDLISKNQIDKKAYISDFYNEFNNLIDDKYQTIQPQYTIDLEKICPLCNKGHLVIKHGKYGDFINCSLYPECKYVAKLEEIIEEPDKEGNSSINNSPINIDHDCPVCGSKLVVRVSKKTHKKFIGCSNYPKCTYLENISKVSKK